LDRPHEKVSGQRVVRTTFRKYLMDWLTAKKAEAASSTMDFCKRLTIPIYSSAGFFGGLRG
jgi:hypothetical protein